MNNLLDSVTVTVSANEPTYIFNIILSDVELDKLAHEKILGMRFKKNKYKFLSDLADVLSDEILKELEKIKENE
jgi:hypothetical protein